MTIAQKAFPEYKNAKDLENRIMSVVDSIPELKEILDNFGIFVRMPNNDDELAQCFNLNPCTVYNHPRHHVALWLVSAFVLYRRRIFRERPGILELLREVAEESRVKIKTQEDEKLRKAQIAFQEKHTKKLQKRGFQK